MNVTVNHQRDFAVVNKRQVEVIKDTLRRVDYPGFRAGLILLHESVSAENLSQMGQSDETEEKTEEKYRVTKRHTALAGFEDRKIL